MSTAVAPGIYTSPYLPYETEVEIDLRNTKPLEHPRKEDVKPKYNPTASRYDLTTPKPPSLPPIAKKPQVKSVFHTIYCVQSYFLNVYKKYILDT